MRFEIVVVNVATSNILLEHWNEADCVLFIYLYCIALEDFIIFYVFC